MSESEKAAYAPGRKTLTSSVPRSLSTKTSSTSKPSTKKASTKKPSTKKPSAKKPSAKRPSTKKPSSKKPSTQKKDEDERRQVVVLFPDGSHSSVIKVPTGAARKQVKKWIPALLGAFELFPRKYKGAKNRLHAIAEEADASGTKDQTGLIREVRNQIEDAFSVEDNWVVKFVRQILDQADKALLHVH
jgi:hypothetical protein